MRLPIGLSANRLEATARISDDRHDRATFLEAEMRGGTSGIQGDS
jgi:hypothetical protein